MSAASDALTAYVNALPAESAFVEDCASEATALVREFCAISDPINAPLGPYNVPTEILDRCILQTGANLYYQKAAKNGIVGFDDVSAAPVRVARDPMLDSYPLLRRYIPVGLA